MIVTHRTVNPTQVLNDLGDGTVNMNANESAALNYFMWNDG